MRARFKPCTATIDECCRFSPGASADATYAVSERQRQLLSLVAALGRSDRQLIGELRSVPSLQISWRYLRMIVATSSAEAPRSPMRWITTARTSTVFACELRGSLADPRFHDADSRPTSASCAQSGRALLRELTERQSTTRSRSPWRWNLVALRAYRQHLYEDPSFRVGARAFRSCSQLRRRMKTTQTLPRAEPFAIGRPDVVCVLSATCRMHAFWRATGRS